MEQRLFRENRRVRSAENYGGAFFLRLLCERVSVNGVKGMNADAENVARLQLIPWKLLDRLID